MRRHSIWTSMNTTLPQAVKILEILKDVPSDKTQKALETGFLSDVLKTGELDTIYQRFEKQLFENSWKIVCLTLRPEEIVVTRPHDPDTYHSGDPKRTGKHQVRVWKGTHGLFKYGGHVSDGGLSQGGPMLLEYYDDGGPQPEDVNDPRANQGTLDNLDRVFPGYEWVKETKEKDLTHVYKGIQRYDVFTIRKHS